jgi:hypothetical protein
MQTVYPVVAALLSFFSRRFPFSLLDILIVAALAAFLLHVLWLVMRKLSLRKAGRRLLLSALWLLTWFYLSWGVAYFRHDFYTRFEMTPPVADADFLTSLTLSFIDSLNNAYLARPVFDADAIDRDIEQNYEARHRELHLPYPCGKRRTKSTLLEPLMTRSGISGFFDPFFNEVQLNGYLLPQGYPFTLAHEKAHQLGIAGEAECNFYAAVICTESRHPLVRYSGYLQTVSYLLGSLRKLSPDDYPRIVATIDARVIDDYRSIQEHWNKGIHEDISAIQGKIYNSYLKTNKQAAGIRSYSEMVGLLAAYYCYR